MSYRFNGPKIGTIFTISYEIIRHIKYPLSPQFLPQEFLTKIHFLSLSNPTAKTACPPNIFSLDEGIGIIAESVTDCVSKLS